jgi:osmotically-inducible protein OsmY
MRVHKLSISIILLTVVMGLPVACPKHTSDEAIAKDIQDKVAADPDTKDSQVNVTAKDGKVTLTGKVKTPAAQQKVEQIAKAEPGQTGVDDQTSVQSDPS